jgi:hypothetical protein
MFSIASRRFLQTGWPIPQLDWPIFNRSLYRGRISRHGEAAKFSWG